VEADPYPDNESTLTIDEPEPPHPPSGYGDERPFSDAPHAEEGPSGLDVVKRYLREIRKYPLLTRDEERELAKRIEAGDDEARNTMIVSNLRLVVALGKRYINRGLPFADVIEEGNIGLMRAVQKFDHRYGYRFSTYASWWIKQFIERAIFTQSRTVRLPIHIASTVRSYMRATRTLQQKLGREPSLEEIASELNLASEAVQRIAQAIQEPLALDGTIGPNGEDTLQELVEDNTSPAPDQYSGDRVRYRHLSAILLELSDNERNVVRRRFGLDSREPQTLAAIGSELGITRERVRQIELASLVKLRTFFERLNLDQESLLS
jgi:RNA polymerase sigma factor (sigma-70 family)